MLHCQMSRWQIKMSFMEDDMDNEFGEDINDEWGLEID